MSNFSPYPITDSEYYSSGDKPIHKNESIGNCFQTQGYIPSIEPNTTVGYNKPINELCKDISGVNNELYKGTSIWNNMRNRKSLVKDY